MISTEQDKHFSPLANLVCIYQYPTPEVGNRQKNDENSMMCCIIKYATSAKAEKFRRLMLLKICCALVQFKIQTITKTYLSFDFSKLY